MSDPTIERIEAELRDSQFKPWDVEAFLANRHRAKIEALEQRGAVSDWRHRWTVWGQGADVAFAVVGKTALAILLGYWLLTGNVIPEREVRQYYDAEGRLAPPPAPPAIPR